VMKSPSNLYFNPNFNSNFNLYLNQNHNLNPYQYQLRHKLDKRIESIEVDGTSATADAQFDLEIRNARTDQRNELQLKLRFNFDFTPEGWRMRRMRRR